MRQFAIAWTPRWETSGTGQDNAAAVPRRCSRAVVGAGESCSEVRHERDE